MESDEEGAATVKLLHSSATIFQQLSGSRGGFDAAGMREEGAMMNLRR
jgi:hypothetical protein